MLILPVHPCLVLETFARIPQRLIEIMEAGVDVGRRTIINPAIKVLSIDVSKHIKQLKSEYRYCQGALALLCTALQFVRVDLNVGLVRQIIAITHRFGLTVERESKIQCRDIANRTIQIVQSS